MRCGLVRRLLGPYEDGDLPAPRASQVEAHLQGCPACVARREELHRAAALVAALGEAEPEADFTLRVLGRIRFERERSLTPAAQPDPDRLWPLALALGAAGLVATAAILWLVMSVSLPSAASWGDAAAGVGRVATSFGHASWAAGAALLNALLRVVACPPVLGALAADLAVALAALIAARWHGWVRRTTAGAMLAL